MALTLQALELLAPHLRGRRILSLGYPDLVVTADDIRRLFGVTPTRFTEFGAWHGVSHPLPETLHIFEAIGASLECVDIHPSRGVERVVDLNRPCDLGRFDVVLDPGTIEHCFNIGQAILNAANAVMPGGSIYHSPPMTMLNHGFYNLSPTLLHDFYAQNGWEIVILTGAVRGEMFEVPAAARFKAPAEACLYCIAIRRSDQPLAFPTQAKYLANPSLA
jgi:hypothetical protein